MNLSDYKVDTGYFGGPLSLLLHLVRRHELDICRVSLSRLTSEFSDHLEVLKLLDLELIGDFIVVAATLLEIKSREVLPKQEETDDEETLEEDLAGSELIQRLLEYRRYRSAAVQLEDQAAEWLERYPRLSDDRPPKLGERLPDRVRGVEIWDLVSALARLVRIPSVEQTTIRRDETPLGVHQDRIRQRLLDSERAAFSSFFEGEKNQSRIVGIFQAILELIRHEHYRAVQQGDSGEIWILAPVVADSPSPRAA